MLLSEHMRRVTRGMAGKHRWLAAIGWMGAAGAALAQPANDLCTAPTAISLGVAAAGTTTGSTRDIEVDCFADDRDVWFVFESPNAGPYQFTLSTPLFGASIAAVTNCGFPYAVMACAQADGATGATISYYSFFPGEQILIRVGASDNRSFTVRADVQPAPANDNCSGATELFVNSPISTNNYGATTSFTLTDQSMCGTISPGFGGGADLFYKITPDRSGFYRFDTCGSEIDTVLSVHSACPASPANAIACNDNAAMNACDDGGTYTSSLNGVHLDADVTYYVRMASVVQDGGFVPQGRFNLNATYGTEQVAPANDDCANAEEVFPGSIVHGSTVNATESLRSSCGVDDPFDVWYTLTSTADVRTLYIFTVQPPAFFSTASLSAYDACGGEETACQTFNPLTNPVMELYVAVDPGETVYVRVAGTAALRDEFDLEVAQGPAAAGNVRCDQADPVDVGQSIFVDTSAATSNASPGCGFGEDSYGLWYTFQAGAAGYYRVETSNLSLAGQMSTTLSLVRGSCDGSSALCTQSGDAFSEDPSAAAGSIRLNAGERVWVRVAYGAAQRGTFNLGVTGPLASPPAVTNDTCAGARSVTLPYNAEDVNITAATTDTIPGVACDPAFPGLAGTWYTFTPSTTGYLRSTLSTNDTRRSIYGIVFSGTCGNLTRVSACPDFSGRVPPTPVVAGTTYRVLVTLSPTHEDQWMEHENPVLYGTTVNVGFELITPPANDVCAAAAPIAEAPADLVVDSTVAGADAIQPTCFGFNGSVNAGVWYILQPETAGDLTVRGECPDFQYSPGGALFEGSCGALTEIACDDPTNGWVITNNFEFTAPLVAGRTYYLLVAAYGPGGGGETLIHVEYTGELGNPTCLADFNGDGFIDFFDYDDYVNCFETGNCPPGRTADANGDGFVDFFDYDAFVGAFESGC